MSDITLVTAYFDIGRGNWKKQTRGNNKYIEYFKFWARLKNNLIIYTTSEFKETIFNIRKNFGLENKTKIIIINDYTDFDENLYTRIKTVMNNNLSKTFYFKHDIHRPEVWNWDYNYIVMLKFYCMFDVVQNNYANGTLAWIDFGFNHGGNDGIINPEEFNFLWQYKFSPKIHLFASKKIDERPIFDIIKSLDVYIRGNIMIAPDYLWKEYFYLTKQSMITLLRCGLCDDDQTIELMAYLEKPELFELHITKTWIEGFTKFSNRSFTLKKIKPKKYSAYKYYKYRAKVFFANGFYKSGFKFYKKYLTEKFL